MDNQVIAREMIQNLRMLQKKPLNIDLDYTGLRTVGEYVRGFGAACKILGFKIGDTRVEEAVYLDSGLKMTPLKTPLQQLKEQGLEDEAIKNKLLDIDIEVLRRLYEITDE